MRGVGLKVGWIRGQFGPERVELVDGSWRMPWGDRIPTSKPVFASEAEAVAGHSNRPRRSSVVTGYTHAMMTEPKDNPPSLAIDVSGTRWFHGGTLPHRTAAIESVAWDRDRHTSSLNEEGPGIYWTSNQAQAESYAREPEARLYEGEALDTFNTVPERPATVDELMTVFDMASTDDQLSFAADYGVEDGGTRAIRTVMEKYARGKPMRDALVMLSGDLFHENAAEYVRAMLACGWDGFVAPKSYGVRHLVVWNLRKMRWFEVY